MGNCTDCMLIIQLEPHLINCCTQFNCTPKHNTGAAILGIGTRDRKLGSDFTSRTEASPLSLGKLSVLGVDDQDGKGQS